MRPLFVVEYKAIHGRRAEHKGATANRCITGTWISRKYLFLNSFFIFVPQCLTSVFKRFVMHFFVKHGKLREVTQMFCRAFACDARLHRIEHLAQIRHRLIDRQQRKCPARGVRHGG